MQRLSPSQQNLISLIKKIERRPNTIIAGPAESDAFERKLTLSGQAIAENGLDLNQPTKALLEKLQSTGSELEETLRNEVMWYDIRSLVWRENPLLSALLALSYAAILIERTSQKTGHIINIALDCYPKHFKTMSILTDTLIRTGIVKDGGGIIYWGVQNGGTIRNVSEFQRAIMGKQGNWVYGTMSHRHEDFAGAKFGMQGKVFCGPDLREDFYQKLLSGNYPALTKIENPEDYMITVGDLKENNIAVAEDLIRARTGTKVPKKELLSGLKLSLDMVNSPINKNLADILIAFGTDLELKNSEIKDFDTEKIIDPNEHQSAPMLKLKEDALKDGRIHLAIDPDGDRGTFVTLDKNKKATSLAGTELLLLATENLATYDPDNLDNDVIYDMRTGVSIEMLAESLRAKKYKINLIASEPGYPFFMELMGENTGAVIAIENTNHAFLTPYTNPIWGAPKFYPNVQGGDDAALFLVYILGLARNSWDSRNPVEQLDFIREKYQIPATIISESKPSLEKKDAGRKYDIAKEMCRIAESQLNKRFQIDTMNSGVRITDGPANAMVLIRYSNSGPAFTVSGETVKLEDKERLFSLGGAIMRQAVETVRKEKGEFDFLWNDFAQYGDISTEKAEEIIKSRE